MGGRRIMSAEPKVLKFERPLHRRSPDSEDEDFGDHRSQVDLVRAHRRLARKWGRNLARDLYWQHVADPKVPR